MTKTELRKHNNGKIRRTLENLVGPCPRRRPRSHSTHQLADYTVNQGLSSPEKLGCWQAFVSIRISLVINLAQSATLQCWNCKCTISLSDPLTEDIVEGSELRLLLDKREEIDRMPGRSSSGRTLQPSPPLTPQFRAHNNPIDTPSTASSSSTYHPQNDVAASPPRVSTRPTAASDSTLRSGLSENWRDEIASLLQRVPIYPMSHKLAPYTAATLVVWVPVSLRAFWYSSRP